MKIFDDDDEGLVVGILPVGGGVMATITSVLLVMIVEFDVVSPRRRSWR